MPDSPDPKPQREKDKSDLVNEAMAPPHKVPSYEAWAMTVEDLNKLLKG